MAQITVTEAEVGQIIASNGVLDSIVLVAAPDAVGYREYLTLTNTVDTLGNDVFNMDPSTSSVGVGSALLSGGGITFADLVLKSLPHGCSVQIDYTAGSTLDSTEETQDAEEE